MCSSDLVGRERATLSRILKTEIIFTQKTFNYLGNSSLIERVLSLPPEQVSLATDLVSPEKKNEEVQNKKAVGVAKKKNEPKIPDFNGVGDINKVNESLQKVMNRPAELEKQLDEMIGK